MEYYLTSYSKQLVPLLPEARNSYPHSWKTRAQNVQSRRRSYSGFGDEMVVSDALEYEERAISLVNGLQFTIAQLEDGSTTRKQGAL